MLTRPSCISNAKQRAEDKAYAQARNRVAAAIRQQHEKEVKEAKADAKAAAIKEAERKRIAQIAADDAEREERNELKRKLGIRVDERPGVGGMQRRGLTMGR